MWLWYWHQGQKRSCIELNSKPNRSGWLNELFFKRFWTEFALLRQRLLNNTKVWSLPNNCGDSIASTSRQSERGMAGNSHRKRYDKLNLTCSPKGHVTTICTLHYTQLQLLMRSYKLLNSRGQSFEIRFMQAARHLRVANSLFNFSYLT